MIDKATPKIARDPLIQQEIVWVPGPWNDPALLDWKRGGRFELQASSDPGEGRAHDQARRTRRSSRRAVRCRQYVYPLPHSTDGSTVADKMKVDVEVRGAQQGSVRTVGYDLKADAARSDVNAMTLEQGGFVPRGDLVVDYRADRRRRRAARLDVHRRRRRRPRRQARRRRRTSASIRRSSTRSASSPPMRARPPCSRCRRSCRAGASRKPRDYVIVVDGSQSMVGERFTRASELAVAMVDDMDRRDRFSVLVCDSECRRMGDLRAPSTAAAGDAQDAGSPRSSPRARATSSPSLRAGNDELKRRRSRERWVLYVGDGFASTRLPPRRRMSRRRSPRRRGSGNVHISTIGIGSDADSALLAAAARGGGGSYLAWVPGQTVGTAALAALESTNGASLRDATVELPAGLPRSPRRWRAGERRRPTTLPTLRAGGEVLIAARIDGDVTGEVVLRGKVAGQPFEQRYPLKLAVSSARGQRLRAAPVGVARDRPARARGRGRGPRTRSSRCRRATA